MDAAGSWIAGIPRPALPWLSAAAAAAAVVSARAALSWLFISNQEDCFDAGFLEFLMLL